LPQDEFEMQIPGKISFFFKKRKEIKKLAAVVCRSAAAG